MSLHTQGGALSEDRKEVWSYANSDLKQHKLLPQTKWMPPHVLSIMLLAKLISPLTSADVRPRD